MLFNSFVFLLLFLPITYCVFWALRTAQARYVWLVITGYVFYGYWDARFCLLMAFSTTVSYVAGRAFLAFADRRSRKLCLIVPITVDLCLLGFFKYANFVTRIFGDLSQALGWQTHLPYLAITLPVGISFYTFHTITYIVDSYRGVIKPTRNIFEFAAYVSLFSQLVAGPIVRFRQVEEDLESLGEARRSRWLAKGISFFVLGMIEKVIVADGLASVVDPALSRYATLSSAGVWLAMLGYAFQLYFDFSGYSDMAVGLGLMFGIRIPQNFASPYKALDPSDFWRRWHISLSTCLRDYLYIPFGGNRHGQLATYRNLMLTMLIGGLWHGANWTFVVWGAYHGMLLLLYKCVESRWDLLPKALRQTAIFILVTIGWVLFRSSDFGMAQALLRAMFFPTPGTLVDHCAVYIVGLVVAGLWAFVGPHSFQIFDRFEWKRPYAYALSLAMGSCIAVMLGRGNSPFLYFQF